MKAGLVISCFLGAFGFVIDESMHHCRLSEGFKRVGADGVEE